jgi:hypothetical protein
MLLETTMIPNYIREALGKFMKIFKQMWPIMVAVEQFFIGTMLQSSPPPL